MANLTNSNKLIEKIDNLNVVRVSNTAPSNPTLWMAWYDSTSSSKMLKIYNGTSWDIVWPEMIPITQDAYDALSPAEKNNWKYYLITDAEGTIIVNWEDIVWAPTIPENTSDLNNDSWFITWINSSDVTTALWFTPYNASNPSWYQTASQVSSAINTALGSVYRYKWSKTTYSQLPTSWQVTWDVWNIEQADSEHWIKAWDNVAWNGSAWDVLSWTVDLTNYFNKTTDNSDSITQWSNNLFLTWTERTKLSNLSWTNTWDETTATIKTKLWAASASKDWYLKKEDFATFNWKQDALTAWDWITIKNGVISSEWESYNAWEWISIWTVQDYSAMQWPAPSGFHVPLTTEWQAVYDIWTALGWWSTDWTNFGIALKLPFAGRRYYSSADVNDQGSNGYYWSSSYRSSTNNSYCLRLYLSRVIPQDISTNTHGLSVRCFKNKPVIPTSTWTKLYWTSIEAGGIFWSSVGWLISLSSDWQTWITISDKNLWATQVWNSWDTLSEANCGKYYQRWNNYWFSWDWTITTSSTQVDASAYWPWNYYSSSTFINRSSSPFNWDSSNNNNLRWWVTWIVTTENAITNTGVLSVNGQTWHVTVESWWKQSYFKTQAEYDALPASKESDGNLYIIVDSHFSPISYEELIQLTPAPDAILAELNKAPKDYAEYYYENGNVPMQEMPSSAAPRPDAYWKVYQFVYGDYLYWYLDSNLTEQEITTMFWGFGQDAIDALINWEWFAVDQWWWGESW